MVAPRWRLNGTPVITRRLASQIIREWSGSDLGLRRRLNSWVYFAWRKGELIKVGWTRNPPKRLESLTWYLGDDREALVLISESGPDAERAILKALHPYRENSRRTQGKQETFRLAPEVLALVDSLRSASEACFFDSGDYEAGPVKTCTACGEAGHNVKRCPQRKAA